MIEYKLTVVGTSDGQYLVNYYYKIPDKKFENISGVIDFIFGLERKVFEAEPSYISISDRDKEILEAIRQGINKRDELVIGDFMDLLDKGFHPLTPVRKYNVVIEVTNVRKAEPKPVLPDWVKEKDYQRERKFFK